MTAPRRCRTASSRTTTWRSSISMTSLKLPSGQQPHLQEAMPGTIRRCTTGMRATGTTAQPRRVACSELRQSRQKTCRGSLIYVRTNGETHFPILLFPFLVIGATLDRWHLVWASKRRNQQGHAALVGCCGDMAGRGQVQEKNGGNGSQRAYKRDPQKNPVQERKGAKSQFRS